MQPSELDLFILNFIREGLATPYDLKVKAGLSVGSTSPVLARLESNRLIEAGEGDVRGSRRFSITESGRNALKRDKRAIVDEQPTDIDAILRITNLSASLGTPETTRKFLQQSAERLKALSTMRMAEAKQTEHEMTGLSGGQAFKWLRIRCEAARLEAQAKVLMDVAKSKLRTKEKK